MTTFFFSIETGVACDSYAFVDFATHSSNPWGSLIVYLSWFTVNIDKLSCSVVKFHTDNNLFRNISTIFCART